jgi:hypothetical protein
LALETLTDNIVDGSQALALKDQVIRNTAVGTIPLVVNSIASTTANLTEFQVDGVKKLEVTPAGGLAQNGTRLFSQPLNNTNTFFGLESGSLTTSGFGQNTIVGYQAGKVIGSANFNSLFGYQAGVAITNSSNHVYIGHSAGILTTTSQGNVGIGRNAGGSITTGTGLNTFVGFFAGDNASQLATATNSTALGNASFTDKSNQMVFGNASVSEILLSRNLNGIKVGIGTTTPALVGFGNELTVSGSGFSGQQVALLNLQGTTTTDANIGAISYFNGTTRISSISGGRSGADTSGRLVFNTSTTGTLTEKMTILPNGNVGIGTASPAQKLSVLENISVFRSASTGFARLFYNTDTTINFTVGLRSNVSDYSIQNELLNSTALVVLGSNNNVGIGTSSPATKLHISGSVAQELRLENTNTAIGLNDLIGTLSFRSNDVSSGGTGIAGSISSISEASAGVLYGLAFNTKNFATETEKMRITAEGKVGIGTSAPATQLDILSSTFAGIKVKRNSGGASVILHENSAGNQYYSGIDTSGNYYILNGSFATTMLATSGGLVGINETLPTAQLQVKSGATTRIPLIVDTLESHTATLQEWKNNGTTIARMNRFGTFQGVQVENVNTSNNSAIALATTGTTISRNVADTNPALIVNLANASATGNIQVWQKAGSALSQISNAGIFVGQSRPTRTDITDNATLALADEGKVLRVNSSSNLTVTIPKNSVVAFPIDTEIAILRYGTGTVSIAPVDGDVTLQSADGERKIKNRYGSVALKKIGTDEWVLVGSLEA